MIPSQSQYMGCPANVDENDQNVAYSHGVDEHGERHVPRLAQKVVRRKVISAVLEIEPNHGFTSSARLADFEGHDRGIVHWRTHTWAQRGRTTGWDEIHRFRRAGGWQLLRPSC
jgi:hypothetical protein